MSSSSFRALSAVTPEDAIRRSAQRACSYHSWTLSASRGTVWNHVLVGRETHPSSTLLAQKNLAPASPWAFGPSPSPPSQPFGLAPELGPDNRIASPHQTLSTRAAMKMKRAAAVTMMSQRQAGLIACLAHAGRCRHRVGASDLSPQRSLRPLQPESRDRVIHDTQRDSNPCLGAAALSPAISEGCALFSTRRNGRSSNAC